MKKIIPPNPACTFTNTKKESRSLSHFVFFVWTAIKHQVQDLYTSWESQVFLIYADQKRILGTHRAFDEHVP